MRLSVTNTHSFECPDASFGGYIEEHASDQGGIVSGESEPCYGIRHIVPLHYGFRFLFLFRFGSDSFAETGYQEGEGDYTEEGHEVGWCRVFVDCNEAGVDDGRVNEDETDEPECQFDCNIYLKLPLRY